MKDSSILEAKGPRVITIKPLDTIAVLAGRLREEHIEPQWCAVMKRAVEGIVWEARDLAYGLAKTRQLARDAGIGAHSEDRDNLCA